MKKTTLTALLFLFFISLKLNAQSPYIVKDLNISESSSFSNIQETININGVLYFTAEDAVHGRELWKSDGTESGTVLVKDIYPGQNGSSVTNGYESLTHLNNTLYFSADDGVNGYQLWKSDGTESGTMLVMDVVSNSGSPSYLTNVNGVLYFSFYDNINGSELWKSDGTAAGTQLIKGIDPGVFSSNPRRFKYVNGFVYFTANNGVNGTELWKSDGTEAGTVMVKDIYLGSQQTSSPDNFTDVNGVLYFSAYNPDHGNELFKSDGTESGTVRIKDINLGSGSGIPNFSDNFTNVNGVLYFSANDGINGEELWKSDGTESGTVIVKDIYSGSTSSSPDDLIFTNGVLYFKARDSVNGKEFWKSDGTESGTVLLKDIDSGPGSSLPSKFIDINGVLYFSASDGISGTELWKSDGTESGTVLVKDINPSWNSSLIRTIQFFTNINGVIYFSANDGVHGDELWKSDGTELGTVLVKDIYRASNNGYPENFTSVNGVLYFSVNDDVNGKELWKSDGTGSGSILVKDIYPGLGGSNPENLTEVNGVLYFTAEDGPNGKELWKSDGTASGTVLVKDINSVSRAGSYPESLTSVNGVLYFSAQDGTNGRGLWKSDGTEAGTVFLKEILSGSHHNDYPEHLTIVNGVLYFSALDAPNGYELWKSDGTASGTVLVKNINSVSGSGSSYPESIINVNDVIYFNANDGVNGSELWKSDGTEAGTVLVKDIYPGFFGSNPRNFIDVNGVLYFSADDGVNGSELWKSDGTESGTTLVMDILPGIYGSDLQFLTNVNGVLYFSASDRAVSANFGVELWKSDGIESGTIMVKDINPGFKNGYPQNLTNVNDVLYFTAYDDVYGEELWKSDGTEAGTVLVNDIVGGISSSNPKNLTNFNGVLYFTASNLLSKSGFNYGSELLALGQCTPNNTKFNNNVPRENVLHTSELQTSPNTATCHCNIFNELMSTTEAVGANPYVSIETNKVYFDATSTVNFVKRHYEIAPETDFETTTGKLTLYFTQEEFDEYNALQTVLLPTGPTDNANKTNINLILKTGLSSDGSGLNVSYPGLETTINPEDRDIVWNPTDNRWEVSFNTTGFGGFWLTNTAVLGVNDKALNTVNIYPNPSSSQIHITGLKTIEKYIINSLLGQQVLKGEVKNNDTIDVSHLPTGIYILSFKSGSVKKIIKK